MKHKDEATNVSATKATILVVDDERHNLDLLAEILGMEGYTVWSANNGTQALDAARFSPDLILLDIMMPDISGYKVCQRLKANEATRNIPVIFLSVLDETENKVKAFAAGAVDYIAKPFKVREVLARVATHVTLRSLQKELEAANRELERRNAELQDALETIKTLRGSIPFCTRCSKKIQDDTGRWVRIETYIEGHTDARVALGICPDCRRKLDAQASQVLRRLP